MSFLFGSPATSSFKQPPAPPPPKTPAPLPPVEKIEEEERKKLSKGGRRGTILTSPRGILTSPKVGKKRLLGG